MLPKLTKGIETSQLSKYDPGAITKEQAVEGAAMIARSKPKLNPETALFIIEEMVADNWSIEKMKDAIRYVAKNCPYPEPQPADYLNYDIFDELYTYSQMMDKVGRDAYVTMDWFEFVRKVGETNLYKFLGYDKTKKR